jgi:hypothetical protein
LGIGSWILQTLCTLSRELETSLTKDAAKVLSPLDVQMDQAIRKQYFAIVQESQSTPPEA